MHKFDGFILGNKKHIFYSRKSQIEQEVLIAHVKKSAF